VKAVTTTRNVVMKSRRADGTAKHTASGIAKSGV
jgi:hypothetical protein